MKKERVTERFLVVGHQNRYRPIEDSIHVKNYMCHRLGEVEDIEDELGVDIVTFYKFFKNGGWIKINDSIEELYPTSDIDISLCFYPPSFWYKDHAYFFQDYGKTWALTKEELKK